MLDRLARRQSEVLAVGGLPEPGEAPSRSLPFGSEGLKREVAKGEGEAAKEVERETRRSKEELEKEEVREQPSYAGPSAAWEKDEMIPMKEAAAAGPSEEELDAFS